MFEKETINLQRLKAQAVTLSGKKDTIGELYKSSYGALKDSFPLNEVPNELIEGLKELERGINAVYNSVENFVVLIDNYSTGKTNVSA